VYNTGTVSQAWLKHDAHRLVQHTLHRSWKWLTVGGRSKKASKHIHTHTHRCNQVIC